MRISKLKEFQNDPVTKLVNKFNKNKLGIEITGLGVSNFKDLYNYTTRKGKLMTRETWVNIKNIRKQLLIKYLNSDISPKYIVVDESENTIELRKILEEHMFSKHRDKYIKGDDVCYIYEVSKYYFSGRCSDTMFMWGVDVENNFEIATRWNKPHLQGPDEETLQRYPCLDWSKYYE